MSRQLADRAEHGPLEIPFTHQGHPGRVLVRVEKTADPAAVGAWPGALDLANCTAGIEYAGRGYLRLCGWVQLVRSGDNAFQGRAFAVGPFDPFELYEQAPSPYCWYGMAPTLFDAPSRDERGALDWLAHSFLAVSPLRGDRRVVTPLLGFSWGFRVTRSAEVTLETPLVLGPADWSSHIPYLSSLYPGWSFSQMDQMPPG